MAPLGSIRVSTLIHIGAVETLAIIFVCYGIAVSHGHVKPWLPMISDCAVYAPEKYPFRIGLALSSFLLCAQVVLVHLAQEHSGVSLFLGVLASLGLAIVSAVNEDENTIVHGGAAVVFYIFYWMYMVSITFVSPGIGLIRQWYRQRSTRYGIGHVKYEAVDVGHERDQDRLSLLRFVKERFTCWLALRQLLALVCGIDLVAFIIMCTHWSKYKLYIAICEWLGTLFIIGFNWSFAGDLSGDLQLAEVIKTLS